MTRYLLRWKFSGDQINRTSRHRPLIRSLLICGMARREGLPAEGTLGAAVAECTLGPIPENDTGHGVDAAISDVGGFCRLCRER
jgi:hypothetical protein